MFLYVLTLVRIADVTTTKSPTQLLSVVNMLGLSYLARIATHMTLKLHSEDVLLIQFLAQVRLSSQMLEVTSIISVTKEVILLPTKLHSKV